MVETNAHHIYPKWFNPYVEHRLEQQEAANPTIEDIIQDPSESPYAQMTDEQLEEVRELLSEERQETQHEINDLIRDHNINGTEIDEGEMKSLKEEKEAIYDEMRHIFDEQFMRDDRSTGEKVGDFLFDVALFVTGNGLPTTDRTSEEIRKEDYDVDVSAHKESNQILRDLLKSKETDTAELEASGNNDSVRNPSKSSIISEKLQLSEEQNTVKGNSTERIRRTSRFS